MQDWLNYHHLRYFWVTAREGSLTRAAARLSLAPSTVSAQIKQLEEHLELQLFERRNRGLMLTQAGHQVASYCDEIFSLGRELHDFAQRGEAGRRPIRLRVGSIAILHKLLVYHLLEPAVKLPSHEVRLVCSEDRPDALVAELALHNLDLVLTDTPIGLAREVHAVSRPLGSSQMIVVGEHGLAGQFRRGFPQSLDGAPMLVPAEGAAVRGAMERWFEQHRVAPRVVADFADSGLMKAFGRQGAGLFLVPELILDAVLSTYDVEPLGPLEGVVEHFYALTMRQRIDHPAVAAIVEGAQTRLAAPG